MFILLALALIIANTLFLVATALQLPGNWLMVLAACGVTRWGPETAMFSNWALVVMAAIALLAEIFELVAGSAGSRRAGGSRRGALLALAGSLAGGILGTFLLPIPIVGSIFGACAGAFLGALIGEVSRGRPMKESLRSGKGAATGRCFGMAAKVGAGILIWLMAAIGAFWP